MFDSLACETLALKREHSGVLASCAATGMTSGASQPFGQSIRDVRTFTFLIEAHARVAQSATHLLEAAV